MNIRLIIIAVLGITHTAYAQTGRSAKISHAEPLYMDLVRDLGARKGEKEWNAGAEISPGKSYTSHSSFIEYEFAPLNRLGFELEVPFTFYTLNPAENNTDQLPHNRMEGIKLATQYTVLVSEKHQVSAAVLYIHEFILHSFNTMNTKQLMLKAHSYSPALVVAKRWGKQFHSMIYTGPEWVRFINADDVHFQYQLNASVHYVLPGSRHFVGVEINQEYGTGNTTVLRPQTKIALSNGFALGLVTGIPGNGQGISFMMRLVYEPSAKK